MYKTFILLKPDTLERNLVGKVIKRLTDTGFRISEFDYMQVTEDTIVRHYAELIEREGGSFRQRVTRSYVGRYVIPIILESDQETIISDVRRVIGSTDPSKALPGTIRGDLSSDALERAISEDRLCENLIHASDSEESYFKEVELWLGSGLREES